MNRLDDALEALRPADVDSVEGLREALDLDRGEWRAQYGRAKVMSIAELTEWDEWREWADGLQEPPAGPAPDPGPVRRWRGGRRVIVEPDADDE